MEAEKLLRAVDKASRKTLYLAGGFHSGWQAAVHEVLGDQYIILDPSTHDLPDASAYTAWDLKAIRRCDAVLAHMENTNPGGYALAMELGFARALGKTIVLVDNLEPARAKYFGMVREIATRRFQDLREACAYLSYIVGCREGSRRERPVRDPAGAP